MADNFLFGLDEKYTGRADDVSGVLIQYVKLDKGGDGASSPITDSNPLPVDGGQITTPTMYNKTLTSADTQYSQALPSNVRFFEFQCLSNFDIRFAFETGKVATPTSPYMTLKAGAYYYSPEINQGASPSTLYLASGQAGVVVQILAWT